MILVDPRVGSGPMLKAISDRVNGAAELAKPQLPGGDFAFEGNGPDGPVFVGVERKTLGDMMGSMRSGRLAGFQLPEMNGMYDVSYVIVEGIWRPSIDGLLETLNWGKWKDYTLAAKGPASKQRFMYSELDKYMVSLESKKNIVVVRSTSEVETVWQLVNRYNWWRKDWDSHNSTDPIKVQAGVAFTKVSLLRQIAAQLPGIGWEKSKLIDKHFKTVLSMANGMTDDWKDAGFGSKVAEKLYKLMREEG